MNRCFGARWTTLEVLEPNTANDLQVFGLRWADAESLFYLTLDESLKNDTLDITEVSQAGSVPDLKVTNKSDRPVFLMAGEQLIGAKQNRILNASILVPALADLTVPVSCVERGRWRYRSSKFGSSGSPSHRRLRKMMSKHVTESYRETGKASSRQGEVWREVDRKLAAMKSKSSTDALEQTYADHQQSLSDYVERFGVPAGCQGAVFAFGGRIAGLDLFDEEATLAKAWPKLLHGYAIDALEASELESEEAAEPVSLQSVRGWLESVHSATPERYKSPGLGDDVRIETRQIIGAGLVVDDHSVHIELYPNDDDA